MKGKQHIRRNFVYFTNTINTRTCW